MDKLEKKIFYVIFSILTIFLISILCIFNYQYYYQEKTDIKNILMRLDDRRFKDGAFKMPDMKREENTDKKANNDITIDKEKSPIFMDTIAYSVIYDEFNKIIEVINHSQEDISEDEIKELAEKFLSKDNKKNINIGNLYIDDYSYSFKGHNLLTILDNTTVKNNLLKILKNSIIIFIFLEIVIIIVSFKLTSWIIKPVIETFNKQKQFITDASHELKTPIAVVMANAEALENEPQEKKWLNNIKLETERMNALISDLLDLAKLENGISKENYAFNNLSKIIETSLLTFESLIYEKKIKFDYNIQEDINTSCNSNQMKQLVAILIDNAINHSNIKDGEIIVSLIREKNSIVLRVTNKGDEIPKDLQVKIFERFYRGDVSRNRDSNRYGLGLAIAKNIVINHNGKIFVKSENGFTTFCVNFLG